MKFSITVPLVKKTASKVGKMLFHREIKLMDVKLYTFVKIILHLALSLGSFPYRKRGIEILEFLFII